MRHDAHRRSCHSSVLSPQAVLCATHPFTNCNLQAVNSALAAGHNNLHWHPVGRHLPDTGQLIIAAASASDLMLPHCHPVVMLGCSAATASQITPPPPGDPCRATCLRVLQPFLLLRGAAALCQHLTAATHNTLTACSLLSQALDLQSARPSLPACAPADQCLLGRPHRSGDHPRFCSSPGGLFLHVLHPHPGRLASLPVTFRREQYGVATCGQAARRAAHVSCPRLDD